MRVLRVVIEYGDSRTATKLFHKVRPYLLSDGEYKPLPFKRMAVWILTQGQGDLLLNLLYLRQEFPLASSGAESDLAA